MIKRKRKVLRHPTTGKLKPNFRRLFNVTLFKGKTKFKPTKKPTPSKIERIYLKDGSYIELRKFKK